MYTGFALTVRAVSALFACDSHPAAQQRSLRESGSQLHGYFHAFSKYKNCRDFPGMREEITAVNNLRIVRNQFLTGLVRKNSFSYSWKRKSLSSRHADA